MSVARLERQGGGCYRLAGEITVETVPRLLADAAGLFAAEPVEIDCEGVEHADSAAVALMLEWMRQADAAGGRIAFRAVPDRVRAIVELSDLEDVIPIAH